MFDGIWKKLLRRRPKSLSWAVQGRVYGRSLSFDRAATGVAWVFCVRRRPSALPGFTPALSRRHSHLGLRATLHCNSGVTGEGAAIRRKLEKGEGWDRELARGARGGTIHAP